MADTQLVQMKSQFSKKSQFLYILKIASSSDDFATRSAHTTQNLLNKD